MRRVQSSYSVNYAPVLLLPPMNRRFEVKRLQYTRIHNHNSVAFPEANIFSLNMNNFYATGGEVSLPLAKSASLLTVDSGISMPADTPSNNLFEVCSWCENP